MIRYGICTNQGECPKADSSEIVPIQGAKDLVCPDCGNELYEVPKPPPSSRRWLKPVLIISLLCLSIGLVWAFWLVPKKPLVVQILGLDCQTGVLSLTATGGDGSMITYGVDNLKSGQEPNKFIIPDSMRNNKPLLVFAMQSGIKVDTNFAANCAPLQDTITIVEVGDTTNINEGLPVGNSKIGKTKLTRVLTWTRVPGSEFCDDLTECVQVYSERNNLGQIRERRIENCADCGAAKK